MDMKWFWAIGLLASAIWAQDAPSADPRQRAKMLRDYAAASGVEAKDKAARIGPYVRDPDVTVQRAAVEALGRVGSLDTLDALVEALRINDETVQIRAASALVNAYSPGYVEHGIAALKAKILGPNDAIVEPHIEVRAGVIEALGRVAASGVSLAAQANAARGVGVLRGKAALPELYRALRTKDSHVLYEALVAIKKIGDRASGPEIAYLLRDLDEDVQLAAIDASGHLVNREAAPRLRELAASGRGKRVRPAAVGALARMPDEADRPLYEARLADPDPAMRTSAVEGLGRLNRASDTATANALYEKERKMEPRLAAAFAAVSLGNRSLAEFAPLRYLSNTLNSAAYAGIAQGYLEELCRTPENRRALIALLPGMTREEKSRNALLLGRTGAADVEETLVTLSRDTDVAVGQAAARALRTLRTSR